MLIQLDLIDSFTQGHFLQTDKKFLIELIFILLNPNLHVFYMTTKHDDQDLINSFTYIQEQIIEIVLYLVLFIVR